MRVKFKVKAKKKRKKVAPPSRQAGPRYWLAVGSLAAYTMVGGGRDAIALAQVAQPGGPASAQSGALPVSRFGIPSGPLEDVLAAFEKVTGLTLSIPNEGMKSLSSPGVTGVFTAEKALQKLLEGTGVSYRFTTPATAVIEFGKRLDTLSVIDRAALASPKYTEPPRDTPQTIMVIPRTLIEEQGALTLRDVLRNVPGLTVAAGEGGTPAGDNLNLRGFSARNDLFVDGVRDLNPQSRDPFNMEQVEVTKGPTSATSGRGSAGGTINMVNKAAMLNRYFGGTLNFGSDDTKRMTADINLPLKPLGERTAFRLNMMGHESGVAGRDVVEYKRWGLAPSLALGLGTPTRLTFSYYKVKQNNISDYGIPWVPATNNVLVEYRDRPAPVPRETFYGLRDRDHEDLNTDSGTFRFDHDFSDGVYIRNQLRYSRSIRDSIASPPRFAGNDTTNLNREMRAWWAEDKVWDNQTDFRASFSTGGIQHNVVTGLNLNREGNLRRTRGATNMPTTLLNPNPDDVYTGVITTSPNVGDVTGTTQAVYLFNTVKLGQHLQAVGGLRWERFAVDGVSTSLAPVERTDKMLSGRAGLVYKPVERGSVYFSHGTSLSPSLEGLSYGTANTRIGPEKTYTTELGSKWDVLNERLSLTGAIFRVEKQNARTPGLLPDDPPQVLAGTQRADGIELGVGGNINRRLRLFGAYTLLATEVVNSNTPAEVGRRIQNAPRNSGNLWATYSFSRFTFGGGPRFVGMRYGNTTNTRKVDGYWTMEAMASASVNKHLDLRLNISNLNDAYYFDRLGGGHVVPGPARTVMVSTAFRF